MTHTSRVSRRRFLQGAAAAGLAGPAIITSSLWSKPNGKPNESAAWVNYLLSTGNKNFLVDQFLISGEYYNGSTTW
jgi:hypothetical protein